LNGKARDGLEEIRKVTLLFRRKVYDNDVGEPTIGRYAFEKRFESG
jgi:hypothetical protein